MKFYFTGLVFIILIESKIIINKKYNKIGTSHHEKNVIYARLKRKIRKWKIEKLNTITPNIIVSSIFILKIEL